MAAILPGYLSKLTRNLISGGEQLFFFDSYAIIELLSANPAYQKYGEETIVTSSLNLGEAYYSYLKKGRGEYFLKTMNSMRVDLLSVESGSAYAAMRFKYENRSKNFSFVDCVGYTLAEENGLTFLTGDKEFKEMPGVEFVK